MNVRVVQLLSAIIFLFVPAEVLAQQQLSGDVDIRWLKPTGFLTSAAAVFHEGENLVITASGTICYAHYSGSTTETTFFFFKKDVPVEEHHFFSPTTAVVSISAVPRGGDITVVGMPIGQQGQLSLPLGNPDAAYELKAYIPWRQPQESPEERSRSHGTYKLTVTLDVSRRLTMLENLVQQIQSGGPVTTEAAFQALICDHIRRAEPGRIGPLVASYLAARRARADFPIDNTAAELLIADGLKMDPTNSALRFQLIDMLLGQSEYERARQAAQDAVLTYRQLQLQSPSLENRRSLGQALLRLATVFESRQKGLSGADLAIADSSLQEAIQHLRAANDAVNLRNALIRRAVILGRIRSIDALGEAAKSLEEVLEILGEVINP